jgi:hypothetical protein
MPTQRLSMRWIREVLRLRHQGLTERVIAQMLGVSNGVVHGYVRRARLAGLSWPLPEGLDDEGLELLLFPAPTAASQSDRRPTTDWVYVAKELRRRSVTRLPLWEEFPGDLAQPPLLDGNPWPPGRCAGPGERSPRRFWGSAAGGSPAFPSASGSACARRPCPRSSVI